MLYRLAHQPGGFTPQKYFSIDKALFINIEMSMIFAQGKVAAVLHATTINGASTWLW